MKKIIIALIVFSLSSVYAAQNEMYVGFSIGKPSISGLSSDSKLKSTAVKIFTGTNINKNVTIEAHYFDKALSLSHDSGNTKASSLGVAALYKITNSEKIIPFVKLGYHRYKIKNSSNNASENISKSGSDMFYGIGALVPINKKINTRVEFEKYKFDSRQSVKYYSIGLEYKF